MPPPELELDEELDELELDEELEPDELEVELPPVDVETFPLDVDTFPLDVETLPLDVETLPLEVEMLPLEVEVELPFTSILMLPPDDELPPKKPPAKKPPPNPPPKPPEPPITTGTPPPVLPTATGGGGGGGMNIGGMMVRVTVAVCTGAAQATRRTVRRTTRCGAGRWARAGRTLACLTIAGRAGGFSATWTAPPPTIAPPAVQAQSFAKAIRTDIPVFPFWPDRRAGMRRAPCSAAGMAVIEQMQTRRPGARR